MGNFKYSFQKILDLKENEKEFAQIQMANAIKIKEEKQQKSLEVYSKIIETEELKKRKEQEGVNVLELRMLEDYTNQLYKQHASSQRELHLMEKNVVKKQHDLQKKVQEEKTWGNLKEQSLNQFNEQSKKNEQAYLDEIAITRFYRSAKY